MPPARACLVTPAYGPDTGGVGLSAQRVARLLAAAGVEQHVALLEFRAEPGLLQPTPPRIDDQGVRVHHLVIPTPDERTWKLPQGWATPRRHQLACQALLALHRAQGFDLLHAFFLSDTGPACAAAARLAGLPLLASIRGNDVGRGLFDPRELPLLAHSLRAADRITSVAQDLLQLADSVEPVMHKGCVIHNSLAPIAPAAAPALPDLPRPWIACAGHFKHKKGLPYLLEALGTLRDRPFGLLLLGQARGPSEQAQLQHWLTHTGMAERCTISGLLPRGALRAILERCPVYVQPSLLSEGCPNTLLEAMAARCACVGTRAGAIPELLEHDRSGLLVPPADAPALATAIRRLLDDPPLRERLGHAGQARVHAWGPEQEQRAWLEVYERTLG